jgi:hypothetical protein
MYGEINPKLQDRYAIPIDLDNSTQLSRAYLFYRLLSCFIGHSHHVLTSLSPKLPAIPSNLYFFNSDTMFKALFLITDVLHIPLNASKEREREKTSPRSESRYVFHLFVLSEIRSVFKNSIVNRLRSNDPLLFESRSPSTAS